MRRLLIIAAAIVMLLSIAPAASAQTLPPDGTPLAWTDLKAQIAAGHVFIPAMQATGYGRMQITGLTKLSNGWYRATWTLTDHQPVSADGATSGFCWPWDEGFPFGSGCSSWGNASTWDWNGVYHWAFPTPGSTFDYERQYNCEHDALRGGPYAVPATSGWAAIFGVKDLVRPTAAGIAIGAVVGCTMSLFW